MVTIRAGSRDVFVELVLFDERLGGGGRFVQIDFEVVARRLVLLQLFFEQLDLAFFVCDGRLCHSSGGQGWDLEVLRVSSVVNGVDMLRVTNSYMFMPDFLVVQFGKHFDCVFRLRNATKLALNHHRKLYHSPFYI